MTPPIAGILPVLHTPFDTSDRIDAESLRREVDWAFEQGANGVCAAMVSEILRLDVEERFQLNEMIVDFCAGRGPVVASAGAESIRQAVVFAEQAVRVGCGAVMAIPPIAAPASFAGLVTYFSAIADAVDVPLIVQDASSYVGTSMSTEFYVRPLDRYGPEKILFKPEGNPVGPGISALRDAAGGRARIFDGSGGILLIDAWRRGIAGTMPGTDLLDGVSALWNALHRGDEEAAYQIYFPICGIVALQMQAGLDGFLAIEKHLMVRRGLFATDRRREPNAWSADAETLAEVDRLFDQLQAILAVT
ncbi:MAG: dihydrodipicolinate synthase family protein [Planctomycetaceae bacterium]|nr:dihydrodipicolinate synthase family protein [Planctomycetaceae bacterium]